MPRKLYCCNGCRNILRLDKPRIHCQICPEYNSCAECHVIEFFSGLHSASHDYEVFLDGNRILTKEGKTVTKLPQPVRLALGYNSCQLLSRTHWSRYLVKQASPRALVHLLGHPVILLTLQGRQTLPNSTGDRWSKTNYSVPFLFGFWLLFLTITIRQYTQHSPDGWNPASSAPYG